MLLKHCYVPSEICYVPYQSVPWLTKSPVKLKRIYTRRKEKLYSLGVRSQYPELPANHWRETGQFSARDESPRGGATVQRNGERRAVVKGRSISGYERDARASHPRRQTRNNEGRRPVCVLRAELRAPVVRRGIKVRLLLLYGR